VTRKVDYYAIVGDRDSREHPSGVLRRVVDDEGESDETFTRDLVWRRSSALYAAERGDLQNEFMPISEDEAMRIVERIRREATQS
jgi:hypothetical protein